MKVSFILPEEVHEKLLMLADELEDINQAVVRGIKELYEKVFEVNEDVASLRRSKERTEGIQEIKHAIERLEEKLGKLGNIEVTKRTIAPQKSRSRSAKVPEVEEIDEVEASVPEERPDLDEMLDDVVVNSGGGKEE